MGVALTSDFKLMLKPEKFLNNVYSGSGLSLKVKDVDAIIALKDISRLVAKHPEATFSMEAMKKSEIKGLIRSVKDMKGREVYAKGKIGLGRISPGLVYSSQTFVQSKKLIDLFLMSHFFDEYDNAGISKLASSLIRYADRESRYIAFYVPPIVETMDKNEISTPLSNLKNRLMKEDRVVLPSENGNGTIMIENVVNQTEQEIMRNSEIQTLQVLRDGMHRSTLTKASGTTIHTININGSEASATSVPLEHDSTVLTSGKPERREDRYLGFNPDSWLDFKGVGIDG